MQEFNLLINSHDFTVIDLANWSCNGHWCCWNFMTSQW